MVCFEGLQAMLCSVQASSESRKPKPQRARIPNGVASRAVIWQMQAGLLPLWLYIEIEPQSFRGSDRIPAQGGVS